MSKISSAEVFSLLNVLAEEKNLSKDFLIEIIESAFRDVMCRYYGDSADVVVKMHPSSGDIQFFQKKIVSENPIDYSEIGLPELKRRNIFGNVGDVVLLELPSIPIQKITANNVQNIILEKIKSSECEKEYNEFKDREGELISGVVKKITGLYIIVGIRDGHDGIIFRENMLRSDVYQVGDKIKAYIKKVQRNDVDCQIILSRTDSDFLISLLANSIIEIQDGIIEIKSIARDPSSKTKIAVFSTDPMLDPVGVCIGPRGSKIKPIVDELRGEKIDILYWHRDIIEFAKGAISPAKPLNGRFDSVLNAIEFVVPDDDLKIAIGRNGQNVRLASHLVGCNITIISESDKNSSLREKFDNAVNLIASSLELDIPVAQFLVSSGVKTPVDLIGLGVDGIMKMGAFDEIISKELFNRAEEYEKTLEYEYKKKIKDLGISSDIFGILEITPNIAIKLAINGEVFNLKDVADLAADEYIEYAELDPKKSKDEAARVVMSARKIVYNI